MEDMDFDFENATARIIALRNLQELKIAGVTVGPLKAGKELETKNWIASELVKAGYARFHDEYSMNIVSLNKIHWRETKLQTGRRISSLPEFFYPQLRRCLRELKEKAVSDASFAIEYDRAEKLARDIVNCRLKKIVSLSSSPSQTENILRSLSKEERNLYSDLRSRVLEWNSKILRVEASK
jgi:hypothetical protein